MLRAESLQTIFWDNSPRNVAEDHKWLAKTHGATGGRAAESQDGSGTNSSQKNPSRLWVWGRLPFLSHFSLHCGVDLGAIIKYREEGASLRQNQAVFHSSTPIPAALRMLSAFAFLFRRVFLHKLDRFSLFSPLFFF